MHWCYDGSPAIRAGVSLKVIVMRICFVFHGKRFCFWIPLLIRDLTFGPHPEPWLDRDVLSKKIEQDLRAVATLHAVAAQLSSDLRRPVQTALEGAMKTLQGKMPEGATLHFQDADKGSKTK